MSYHTAAGSWLLALGRDARIARSKFTAENFSAVARSVTQLLPRAMQLSTRSGRYVRETNMGQLAE